MKWVSLLLAVLMVFSFAGTSMADPRGPMGYGNDPGELLVIPAQVVWAIFTLPIYVVGGLLGGSYYSRGYGSWYTPSWQ